MKLRRTRDSRVDGPVDSPETQLLKRTGLFSSFNPSRLHFFDRESEAAIA